jgi:hypothetical protein
MSLPFVQTPSPQKLLLAARQSFQERFEARNVLHAQGQSLGCAICSGDEPADSRFDQHRAIACIQNEAPHNGGRPGAHHVVQLSH